MNSPDTNPKQLLRMADASFNRLAEGLRYLEDVCRFAINDAALNQHLKNLRHKFTVSEWPNQQVLLDARDAAGDVGTNLEAAADKDVKRDLSASVVANSRRVQEALRSLEETAKVIPLLVSLAPADFQQARFEMYSIEKELLGKITRQTKASHIYGLYVVIDTAALKGRSHLEMTAQVIRGGAGIIQLRDKTMDRGQLLPIAAAVKALCAQHHV
ncbi:MAG: thiamine phosphate synthase, partial [Dehalococcoidales bacterium]|nr:thiamine phosphate synthase [Dehalococcoidales bacterium]